MTLLETVASVGVVGIMVAVGVPWCRTPPSHALHAPPQLRHLFVRGVSALASAMLLMLEPCAGHGAFHPSGSPSVLRAPQRPPCIGTVNSGTCVPGPSMQGIGWVTSLQ